MYQVPVSSSSLKSKQHFEILDGLRGVAAVAVVIFHFMEIAVPDYTKSFIAHAYLAVDFFFCLSGFVIAYAYDQRLNKIGLLKFFKLRLIRLHPLVIIGSIIGLIAFVFDPFSNLHEAYSNKTLLMFLASCFMVPYPLVHERYFNLFHLNPPTWSLFWEYIANIVYVLVLVKVRNKALWLLTLIGAVALCYEAHISGNLGVGWGGDNISGGGIRVFYSFLAGILIYRSGWIINSRLGFISSSALLVFVFLIPFAGKTNPFVDPLIVIFFFPPLVALGAGAKLKSSYTSICRFSGDVSYPLYMIHYPFIWLFMSWVELKKPSINEMSIVMILGVTLLLVVAYLVMIFIDEPIRRYLKNKMGASVVSKVLEASEVNS
ncbi:acyltransferase family protein [Mucilaginibacter aquaedulcis]|uniref:acyltransferase family protein n=1 Tax=Mucilaginibacter aquaedulcis TaxID=1187081 RepID=UPI0025B5BE7A|nr:acyltransferase [Mucilaginibacter aquaedulcis]MDN3548047.1 acyltransferase [Mucilaginibacter aquaedulcis]